MINDLLPYYQQELSAIRVLAKEFAEAHPKIAARLSLDDEVCEDPHVERLIESFAFLAARVQKKLNDDFPEITNSLLGVVYPHFLRPIPSMSIAQFEIDFSNQQLTSAYPVPRFTNVLFPTANGVQCKFRTCYDVELYPIEIAEASFKSVERSAFASGANDVAAVLHLRLKCVGESSFQNLDLNRLRVYLDGEGVVAHSLYELLCNNVAEVIFSCRDSVTGEKRQIRLQEQLIFPVGFEETEALIEHDARTFAGHRLLLEYFAFPEKFLFLDFAQLHKAKTLGAIKELDIAIGIKRFGGMERMPYLTQNVFAHSFKLGCSPIINLFNHPAEPIRLTGKQVEYSVIPSLRKPQSFEVYQVTSVDRLKKIGQQTENTPVRPLFGLEHESTLKDAVFWHQTRTPAKVVDDKGTDVAISLVDLKFDPADVAEETLTLSLVCTNRDLPSFLPFGGETSLLEMEEGGLVSKVRCLRKPTHSIRPAMGKGTAWRLISHLSLNYLSLVQEGKQSLQEILNLYNIENHSVVRKQIEAIIEIKSGVTTRRVGSMLSPAFVRGTQIELELDEAGFTGASAYLFAAVLEHFFSMYSSLNSFTELHLKTKQREGVVAKWPPRAGRTMLL